MNLVAFLVASSASLFVSVAGLMHSYNMLQSYGIGFIDTSYLILPMLLIFFQFSTAVFGISKFLRDRKTQRVIFYTVTGFGILLSFYLFVVDSFFTDSVISSVKDKWVKQINTRRMRFIEHNLKCCGFSKVGEFSKEQCKESTTTPCLERMKEMYRSPIKKEGVLHLMELISFCVMLVINCL